MEKWLENEGHLESSTTIKMVADYLGVSVSQLAYYSQTYLKGKFSFWRKRLRIEEAKRLIEEDPNRSMTSIRTAVGIEDKSNFIHDYYSIMGIKPGEYRKKRQKIEKWRLRISKVRGFFTQSLRIVPYIFKSPDKP